MDETERFDYGKAVEETCDNCGVIIEIHSSCFSGILCPSCNDVITSSSSSNTPSQMRCSDDRERNLLPNDTEEPDKILVDCRTEDPSGFTEFEELVTESLGRLSIESTNSSPERYEASSDLGQLQNQPAKLSKTPTEGNDENGKTGICLTCGELKSSHECLLCCLAVFKRGVLSRADQSLSIYFIPREKFDLVFYKIAQNEAAAYEGTEIAVLEDSGSFFFFHPQMAIKNELTVGFEMDHGEQFSINSPAGESTTLSVQHLLAKSEERLFPGACVKLVYKYIGEENTLHEDKVKMELLSEKARIVVLIPTKSPHIPTDRLLQMQNYSVTGMPQLDREALQTSHVDLINNIGDLSSVCYHLYQYNILTADDKAFLKRFQRPSEGIDELLMMIPKKGHILDIFIHILLQSRENQEAAKILVQKRFQLYGKTERKQKKMC